MGSQPMGKWLIFHIGIWWKLQNLHETKSTWLPAWDWLIFDKLWESILGNRIRFIATGSAPVSPEILNFLKVIFSVNLIEGYGLTETTGSGTL